MSLEEKTDQGIWIGKTLFDRGKVTGSSANMSFIHDNTVYITRSGSCFGNLRKEDFAKASLENKVLGDRIPSKELPLHTALYNHDPKLQAVIHVHSTYAVLWSTLKHKNSQDVLDGPTPYLKLKAGRVQLVPYAPPGSGELFKEFKCCLGDTKAYLLSNHGPIVGGSDLMEAFFLAEELEETAKIMWLLKTNSNIN